MRLKIVIRPAKVKNSHCWNLVDIIDKVDILRTYLLQTNSGEDFHDNHRDQIPHSSRHQVESLLENKMRYSEDSLEEMTETWSTDFMEGGAWL